MPPLPDATASLLLGTAASLAAVHTLIGVDHSIPFVVLGRARGWSLRRTLGVTGVCGLAHVASSVLIGLVGVGLGVALDRLSWLESARGDVTVWLLIGLGLAYAAWALWKSARSREHVHSHIGRGATPWALFLVFAFGPCEALIPLMMVPAAENAWWLLAAVVGVCGFFTVGAMLAAVALGYVGLARARLGVFERKVDVLAGLAVAASGAAVLWLGV